MQTLIFHFWHARSQVPKRDIIGYSVKLVDELYAPLRALFRGELTGDASELVPLVLMCETVLSSLPATCRRDLPYALLKEYGMAPVRCEMSRDRHVTLCHCATVDVETGLLRMTTASGINGLYLVPSAVQLVPRSARAEIFQAIQFLSEVKGSSHAHLLAKAAAILVDKLLRELVSTNVLARRSITMQPSDLVRSGGTVNSVIAATAYVRRAFDPTFTSPSGSIRGFMRVALDILPHDDLFERLAVELMERCKFVPRLITHAATVSASSVCQFQVLSGCSLQSVMDKVSSSAISFISCSNHHRCRCCPLRLRGQV